MFNRNVSSLKICKEINFCSYLQEYLQIMYKDIGKSYTMILANKFIVYILDNQQFKWKAYSNLRILCMSRTATFSVISNSGALVSCTYSSTSPPSSSCAVSTSATSSRSSLASFSNITISSPPDTKNQNTLVISDTKN